MNEISSASSPVEDYIPESVKMSESGPCHSALHNMSPGVTVGGFCSYDGGTTYRIRIKQIRRGRLFSQICALYRTYYEQCLKPRDGQSLKIQVTEFEEFGEFSYRKAAYRELLYFPKVEQPPAGDVFDFGDFRIVFDCHIGDGLFDFRNGLSNAVVIFGWRMFERVSSLVDAYKIVEEKLSDLGFKIIEYSIRRVDINLTTSKIPINTISDAIKHDCYRTKAKKGGTRFSRHTVETVYVGMSGSSIIFRAYDKTQELSELKDEFEAHEKAVAIFSRLGLQSVSQITRLEFELGAEFFKDSRISTFEELETKLKSAITYLFRDWLRFLSENVETYRHKDREKVADWWNWARIQFEEWADRLSVEKGPFRRESHDVESGAHLEALAKTFLLVAASHYKRVNPNLNARELAVRLVQILQNVDLPEWGGAKNKKDLIMNFRFECARIRRENEMSRRQVLLEHPDFMKRCGFGTEEIGQS